MVCDVTVEALFGSTVHHHPAAGSSFHNCPRIHRVHGRIVSVYGEMRPRTWLPERGFVSLQCCYINGGPGEDLMRCVVFVVSQGGWFGTVCASWSTGSRRDSIPSLQCARAYLKPTMMGFIFQVQ